jgi:hypothetical protein
LKNEENYVNLHCCTVYLAGLFRHNLGRRSNQLITKFVSTEFINYVKITRHVSAHLEPSSGDTLLFVVLTVIYLYTTGCIPWRPGRDGWDIQSTEEINNANTILIGEAPGNRPWGRLKVYMGWKY